MLFRSINISGDISLIEANEAASYVQDLAGDDANIIFGAMYDENAQDEASITVIATGLDGHAAGASVDKAMAGFNNFKPKMPGGMNFAGQGANPAAAAAEASATARPNPQQAGQRSAPPNAGPQQSTSGQAAAYRPMNRDVQIYIPDFLKNKR